MAWTIVMARVLLAATFLLEASHRGSPIEQQTPGGATQPDQTLWVVNPTPCVWDADDDDLYRGAGDLPPGGRATGASCVIGDWKAHIATVNVIARSPSLQVEVALEGDGLRFTAPALPAPDGHRWRYAACLYGPDYDQQAPLPMVEGSNGGVGIRWVASVTVANPTTRTVRDAAMSFRVGREQAQADCRAELLHASPKVWRGFS